MGGKQNRTKNNVRPSNSGRSAAMLHSSLPQFTGFAGVNKPTGFSSFAFNPIDEFDSSIDDHFQLALKKVSKKDSTTKLKGLQEFIELLQKAELPIIKTLLPIWPRFYSLLVIHPDNRIREAAQNVHQVIVLKAKREIAPYLKQLMAPWYTSQYDNYPPAAAAAVQAFKDTFSPQKFKEAVNFCHQEILNYILDNLLNQTPENIPSNQLSSQEAEARYERVVISCLQGYAMYLKEVSKEKKMECISLNTQIISNKKFWKLATSKVPLVRSSWFQVLSVMLQEAIYLLKSKETQTLLTILNNLEDDEPNVLPHVWECLLLATSIPEWWKCVNIDQHFTPKILSVLKQAGNGNAAIIYPNFLPLLSKVPSMEEKKKKQFYTHFFENMCLGIRLKSIASNSQESKVISLAYIECLQYLITRNESNIPLCKTLIKQLCSLIEWCLTKEAVSYNIIFNQMSNFVVYLRKNSNLEEIQTLIEFFFTALYDLFDHSLNHHRNTQNISLVARKQIDLLLSLNKVDLINEKQLLNNESYINMVQEFGVNICKIYLNYTEQESSNELMEQLYVLMNGLGKHVILKSLIEQLKEAKAEAKYMEIYSKWLKKWLLSDKMYCKSVLDLIFLLLDHLEDNDKGVVLNDLTQTNQPTCFTWSVSLALSIPYVQDKVVQKWLKGETVGNLFISIAERFIANDCSSDDANMFKLALTGNNQGLLIDKDVLHKIIEQLSLVVSNDGDEIISLDSTCSLAVLICRIIYTKKLHLTYGDQLLVALINLTCKIDDENHSVSIDTLSEVNSVWKNSLTILLQNLDNSESEKLIEKLFKSIEENFRSTLVSRRRGHADHLNHVVIRIVNTISKSCETLLTWLVEFLCKQSLKMRENIIGLCKVAEYIKGTLDCPYEEIPVQNCIDEEEMLGYFTYNFLNIQVLTTRLYSSQLTECSDEDTDDDFTTIRIFDLVKNPADNLLVTLYSYTITDTFLAHFNNVKHYNEILYCHNLFEQRICIDIFENMGKEVLTELTNLLKANCLNHGWIWCKTAYVFYTRFLKTRDILEIYNELSQNNANTNLIGFLHLKQIFSGAIGDSLSENANDRMANLFSQIESLRNQNLPQFLYEHSEMSWQHTNQVIKAVKQCVTIMESSILTQRYWDFIVLSMVSWISNCFKAKRCINQYQYQAMLVSATDLYIATSTRIAKLKEEQTDMIYANEWEDVLLEGIHADLAQIWIFMADHFSKYTEESLLNLPILQHFGKITDFIKYDLIFKGGDNFPKWTKFLKISSGTLLTNSQTILQLWGHKMLLILVPGLVKIDDEAVNTTTPHRNGLIFEQFKEKLIEVQDIVNSVLTDFRIGENTCKVEPSYDSFTYTFAYLLLWDVMLSLCENASTELRYQYSDWLRNGPLLHQFLSNLFKLMPTEVLQYDEGKLKSSMAIFMDNPVEYTCYSTFCGSSSIENLACYLYKLCLEQFPALVRQWWTVLDPKTSQIVEKVTVLYVSPHICNGELNNVVQHQNVFKNLKVKVMPSVREIQAVYTIDETQMELTITLPPNYPLGSPNIVCNRQISGASQKQWLLQFKKCVLHQNGKIWDGLSLWNANLDRKFDGVEECYICYAVLHSGTYQLPKLCCRTCKKKFHSPCLYKWFSTSNKSSCPICRNLF